MPFEIQANDRIIRLIFSGHVTEADGIDIARELTRVEENYEIYPDRLAGFSAVERSDFKHGAIERRAEGAGSVFTQTILGWHWSHRNHWTTDAREFIKPSAPIRRWS